MFQLNDQDIKKMEKRLQRMSASAIPFATKATLNSMAFGARKEAQNIIQQRMTLRNKFTVSSVRVDQARGTSIPAQKSVVGSIAPYMDEQEFGGTKNRKSGKSVGIPTGFSAGQRGARPRTRLPRAAYKMATIQLRRGGRRGANAKQRNAIAIATSLGSFAFLDLGRRKGIFKIDKKGNPTMVHDLSRKSVRIPQLKWMKPAVDHVVGKRGEFYTKALQFQLDRLG